jgi:hypothetical protein
VKPINAAAKSLIFEPQNGVFRIPDDRAAR